MNSSGGGTPQERRTKAEKRKRLAKRAQIDILRKGNEVERVCRVMGQVPRDKERGQKKKQKWGGAGTGRARERAFQICATSSGKAGSS